MIRNQYNSNDGFSRTLFTVATLMILGTLYLVVPTDVIRQALHAIVGNAL